MYIAEHTTQSHGKNKQKKTMLQCGFYDLYEFGQFGISFVHFSIFPVTSGLGARLGVGFQNSLFSSNGTFL